MKVYNKLVRDKIIDIIKDDKKECEYEVLDKSTTLSYLVKKFYEEIDEFKEEYSLEELADILEIIHGIAYNLDIDFSEVEKIREKKYLLRGGFRDRILLKKVWNKNDE